MTLDVVTPEHTRTGLPPTDYRSLPTRPNAVVHRSLGLRPARIPNSPTSTRLGVWKPIRKEHVAELVRGHVGDGRPDFLVAYQSLGHSRLASQRFGDYEVYRIGCQKPKVRNRRLLPDTMIPVLALRVKVISPR